MDKYFKGVTSRTNISLHKAISFLLNKNNNSVLIRLHNSFKACLWRGSISSSKLLN